jgi:hypothetical protein
VLHRAAGVFQIARRLQAGATRSEEGINFKRRIPAFSL